MSVKNFDFVVVDAAVVGLNISLLLKNDFQTAVCVWSKKNRR